MVLLFPCSSARRQRHGLLRATALPAGRYMSVGGKGECNRWAASASTPPLS